jgi:hypothetical protein
MEPAPSTAAPRQSKTGNLSDPAERADSCAGRISSASVRIQDCHLECRSNAIMVDAPVREAN